MSSYNKILMIGNLTRDPALKFLPNQTAVCEFGVAMNRKYKTSSGEEREDVVFVDISAFGKTGENINQYFTKGKPIFLEGRLKFDQWEDKNGGGRRSKLSVICENFQFVGGREDAPAGDRQSDERPAQRQQSGYGQGNPNTPSGGGRPPAREPVEAPFGSETQFKEDDIPFNHRLPARWI